MLQTECILRPRGNGVNAAFDEKVHCVAAEPNHTFLRVGVSDRAQEVAFATMVLGRLRAGYRAIPLRGLLGTRIELAFVFVRISFQCEPNLWNTPRQLRIQSAQAQSRRQSIVNQVVSEKTRAYLAEIKDLKRQLEVVKLLQQSGDHKRQLEVVKLPQQSGHGELDAGASEESQGG
eukprot:480873-Prymnesium_polylepis.1